MKSSVFLTLMCCVMLTNLSAQTQHIHTERCLSQHAIQQRIQQYPAYAQAIHRAFSEAQHAGQQHAHLRNTLVVPVAIHVVWKTAAENIHDSIVQQQIDILNEDYQRLNSDTANLRSRFMGIAANPQIQFRLDTIIRTHTDTLFYSAGLFPDVTLADKAKRDCSGGSDALDVEKYLNIWFCNMGTSGVLGFAYPPANLSNWPADSEAPSKGLEGVVIDYRVVGRSGVYTITSPFGGGSQTVYTQGRTATHETGHYLGLRHIWGDGQLSVFGIIDCSGDDGINDTPTAGRNAGFECDTTRNTCDSATVGDMPDLIENYMDYASEDCMNMFTADQVALIRGTLSPTGARAALATNTTFHAPPSNDKVSQATVATVNTNNLCTTTHSGSNLYANPSYIASCATPMYDYDVWYKFVAPHTDITMELSNVTAAQGSSNSVAYELFSTVCNSPVSIDCGVANSTTFTGLTVNHTYYLRVLSNDSLSRQNFTLCLRSNGVLSTIQNINSLAQAISVYPNPTQGQFTVQLPENGITNGQLTVRNVLGQSLGKPMLLDAAAQSIQLDLSQQPAGFYFVEIAHEGAVIAKKIEIRR